MRRFRIALDARRAVRSVSGIGHYVMGLATWLPRLAPDMDFLLLVDREMTEVPEGCSQVVLGRYFRENTAASKLYSPFWMNYHVPRLLSQYRVDVFHGTNYGVPMHGRWRCVSTVHDLTFTKVPSAYDRIYRVYMRRLVQAVVRRADELLVGSVSALEDLAAMARVPRSRVTVVYHGIGEDFHVCSDLGYLRQVKVELGLPDRFLLQVGVLEAKKNIQALLQASVAILERDLVDKVVLAGRDGLGARLIRSLPYDLGIADKVCFLGYVPQEYMVGLYNMATSAIFPSWYEGFGMPVLEAMACGTPVIASRSSSIPEVAGDAAMLFDPSNPVALGEALVRVLSDSELRRDMSRRGLERARQFSWRRAAAGHLGVYRRLLARESGGGRKEPDAGGARSV